MSLAGIKSRARSARHRAARALRVCWWWLSLPFRRAHGRWLGSTIIEADKDTGEVLRIPGYVNLLDTTRCARLARGLKNLTRRRRG